MPQVSIVIPVCNVERYLRECLDSVVNQTLKDLEIICVDDGSTDGSVGILEEYARGDGRFRIVRRPNQGAAEARNRGLEIARGDYVVFLDSDDFFEPLMLEHLAGIAARDDADVVLCNFFRFSEETGKEERLTTSCDRTFLPPQMPFAAASVADWIFQTTIACPWNKLFRREFLVERGLRFQDLPNSNDLAMIYSALALARRISYSDCAFVHYRVRGNASSLQGTKRKNPLCFLLALRELRRRLEAHGVWSAFASSWLETFRVHMAYNFRTIPEEALSAAARKEIEAEYEQARQAVAKEIRVSVLIAAKNAERTIGRTLDSLIAQTLKEIEILVVDNDSADGTPAVVRRYAERDGRVRLLACATPGQGACRNFALAKAVGRYVAYVDADDWVDGDYLKVLYQNAQVHKADVSMTTAVAVVSDAGGFLHSKKIWDGPTAAPVVAMQDRARLLLWSAIACNKIYRRRFLLACGARFGETAPVAGEDKPFDIAVLTGANRLALTDRVRYHYVRSETSSSHTAVGAEGLKFIEFYRQSLAVVERCSRNPDERIFWRQVVMRLFDDEQRSFAGRMEKSSLPRLAEACDAFRREVWPARASGRAVVSLTSHPGRIRVVEQTVASLLDQTVRVDALVLWLATEQFPRGEAELPASLLALKRRGLSIRWCEDLGSYKKLVPAMRAFPGQVIITADDDVLYPRDFVERLLDAHARSPQAIIANRVREIALEGETPKPYDRWMTQWTYRFAGAPLVLPVGCAGVLYPPGCIADGYLDARIFLRLAPQGDDLWFWAAAVLSGTLHHVACNAQPRITEVEGSQADALMEQNVDCRGNDEKFAAILRAYPRLKCILVDAAARRLQTCGNGTPGGMACPCTPLTGMVLCGSGLVGRLKGGLKLLAPYGMVRYWLWRKWHVRIEAPPAGKRSFAGSVARVVKSIMPFGVIALVRRIKYDETITDILNYSQS